jgi:3-hydroxymyristoyl/3-hydroxydecanoyl-(acyl carrier protein) dehydratase
MSAATAHPGTTDPITHSITLAFADPHPACEGHFPDAPVVPAVVLLDEVMRALAACTPKALTVGAAKFLAPVRPGQILELSHEAQAGGELRFTLRCGPVIVASGLLRPAEV